MMEQTYGKCWTETGKNLTEAPTLKVTENAGPKLLKI